MRTIVATTLSLLAAGVALTGCGVTASHAQRAAGLTPASGASTTSAAGSGAGHSSRGGSATGGSPVSGTHLRVIHAHITPAVTRDDLTPHVTPPDPCRLVSLARARSLTQGAVASVSEAPLGPTCIYHTRHAGRTITLAVAAGTAGSSAGPGASGQRLDVAGRQAVCRNLGQPTLIVGLRGGRSLLIAAPCRLARAFAQIAVPRLSA